MEVRLRRVAQPNTPAPAEQEATAGETVVVAPAASGKGGDSAATEKAPAQPLVVQLALAGGLVLFHTADEQAYADIPVGKGRRTMKLGSKAFGLWLKRLYFEETNESARKKQVSEALELLEAIALFDGEEAEVHVRVAEHGGRVYYDLGGPDCRVVEVSPAGWGVIDRAPVRFARPKGMRSLPAPEPGGALDELWRFVNLRREGDRELLVAWITGFFRPMQAAPLAAFISEQGSAKSTSVSALLRLVDPGKGELTSKPRSARDLMLAAQKRALLGFDCVCRSERAAP